MPRRLKTRVAIMASLWVLNQTAPPIRVDDWKSVEILAANFYVRSIYLAHLIPAVAYTKLRQAIFGPNWMESKSANIQ